MRHSVTVYAQNTPCGVTIYAWITRPIHRVFHIGAIVRLCNDTIVPKHALLGSCEAPANMGGAGPQLKRGCIFPNPSVRVDGQYGAQVF